MSLKVAAYVVGAVYLLLGTVMAVGLGGALVLLLVPGVLTLARGWENDRRLRATAREAVLDADERVRGRARDALLALGRRSGRQPHVDEIVSVLRATEDDAIRARAVTLLGSLSYLGREVLDEFRGLHDETADDRSRASLHAAVSIAMQQVDPYGA